MQTSSSKTHLREHLRHMLLVYFNSGEYSETRGNDDVVVTTPPDDFMEDLDAILDYALKADVFEKNVRF